MKYRIDDTVINSDHIVSVEYIPASSGIDDETGQPYNFKPRAYITTSAVKRDIEPGWDGSVAGVGTKSSVINLRGEQADRFWALYSADAVDVMAGEAA